LKGLVLKSTGSQYLVKTESNHLLLGKIKGNLRLNAGKGTNPIAVGDWVEYSQTDNNSALITEIHSRKNYIIRRSSNLSRQYHILAANIDQALLMVSLSFPATPLEFIDRFLVTAEAYSIPVLIAINKIDLLTPELKLELESTTSIYQKIGYSCFQISIKEGIGIDKLAKLLVDRVTFISGNSGVGKTSFINYLEPGLDLKVAEISKFHKKGKHTTTFYEMFEMSKGGFIIDSPGIKGFGTVDLKREEIFHFFPEIFSTSKNCQFNNCIHLQEPGCAVIQALKENNIAFSRYRSYISLLNNEEEKYR
jgi:ribosome biogenesis GTPase / thiamine phosphate phosphatase